MDHNMVLSYDYSSRNRRRRRTNVPPSRAISMTMKFSNINVCISYCRKVFKHHYYHIKEIFYLFTWRTDTTASKSIGFFYFLPGGTDRLPSPKQTRNCAMTLIMEHSQNSLLVWVTEANREKKRLTRSRFLLRVQNPVANRLYVHEEGIIIWGITSVSSWGQQALVILSSVHQNIVLSQCRKTRSKSGPP